MEMLAPVVLKKYDHTNSFSSPLITVLSGNVSNKERYIDGGRQQEWEIIYEIFNNHRSIRTDLSDRHKMDLQHPVGITLSCRATSWNQ